ncbi:MAG: hypothetical protein QXV17_13560 [Candidatus Micrarchaeaceae archaeon]
MSERIVFGNEVGLIFPLRELERKLHKKRHSQTAIIKKLIDDFVKENGPGYTRLNELLIKMMEADLNIYEFSNEDIRNFKNEMEKMDKKFKYIDKIMSQLSASERKEVWLDKYNRLAEATSKKIPIIREFLIEKEEPTEIDYMFFSYYLYFVKMVETFVHQMKRLNEKKFDELLPVINIATILYGPLLVAYTQGKLKREVLMERLSELAIFTEPTQHSIRNSVKPLLKSIEGVPPCPL